MFNFIPSGNVVQMGTRWFRSNGMIVTLLCVSALIKGIVLSLDQVITPDGPIYIEQARLLLIGNVKTAMSLYGNNILYPALIALFSFFCSDLVFVGQFISFLFSVFALVPIFLFVCLCWNRQVALWASVLWVAIPGINIYSTEVMRDPGFLFALSWGIYFAIKSINEEKVKYFLFTSFFSFLSVSFRIEGFVFPVVFCFTVLIVGLLDKRKQKRMNVGLIAFLCPVVLAGIILFLIMGFDFIYFNRSNEIFEYAVNFFDIGIFKYLPEVKPILKNLEIILPNGSSDNDIGQFVSDNIRMIYLFGLLTAMAKVLYVPYVVPLVMGLKNIKHLSWGEFLLCFLWLVYTLMAFLFLLHRNFLEDRFVYVPVLLFLPYVAMGLDKIFRWSLLSRFRWLCFPLCIFIFIVLPISDQFDDITSQEISIRRTGEWLGQYPEFKEKKLLANDWRVPMYAGRGLEYVPFAMMADLKIDSIELLAEKEEVDLVAIVTRKKWVDQIPSFDHYSQLAKFEDPSFAGLIYRRKEP